MALIRCTLKQLKNTTSNTLLKLCESLTIGLKLPLKQNVGSSIVYKPRPLCLPIIFFELVGKSRFMPYMVLRRSKERKN